jgi:hypothetical protein
MTDNPEQKNNAQENSSIPEGRSAAEDRPTKPGERLRRILEAAEQEELSSAGQGTAPPPAESAPIEQPHNPLVDWEKPVFPPAPLLEEPTEDISSINPISPDVSGIVSEIELDETLVSTTIPAFPSDPSEELPTIAMKLTDANSPQNEESIELLLPVAARQK